MLLEIHALQNLAPSNLNRDESGQPKTAWFGGHLRQRVSSQSWKHAMRMHFNATLDPTQRGVRTRRIVDAVTPYLADLPADEIPALVTTTLEPMLKVVDGNTPYLLFLSQAEIQEIAALCRQRNGDKQHQGALVRRIFRQSHAVDIALFGRMIADHAPAHVDGAAHVAHAISTNRVPMANVDYFTAVDDLQPAGQTGAAMIGEVEYSASCLYRYASVDGAQLLANVHGDMTLATQALTAFAEAFLLTMPGGKQHSFATFTPPSLFLGVVRDCAQRWQLSNAFAQPLSPKRDQNLIELSALALDAYWYDLVSLYGDADIQHMALGQVGDWALPHIGKYRVATMPAWLAVIGEAMRDMGVQR